MKRNRKQGTTEVSLSWDFRHLISAPWLLTALICHQEQICRSTSPFTPFSLVCDGSVRIYRCVYMWLCAWAILPQKDKISLQGCHWPFHNKSSHFVVSRGFLPSQMPHGQLLSLSLGHIQRLEPCNSAGQAGCREMGQLLGPWKGFRTLPLTRPWTSFLRGRGRNPGWKDFVDFTTFWVTFGSALFTSYFYRAIKWEETWVFHSSLTSGTIPSPSCQETHPSHWPLASCLKRTFNSFFTFQMEMSQTEMVAS